MPICATIQESGPNNVQFTIDAKQVNATALCFRLLLLHFYHFHRSWRSFSTSIKFVITMNSFKTWIRKIEWIALRVCDKTKKWFGANERQSDAHVIAAWILNIRKFSWISRCSHPKIPTADSPPGNIKHTPRTAATAKNNNNSNKLTLESNWLYLSKYKIPTWLTNDWERLVHKRRTCTYF